MLAFQPTHTATPIVSHARPRAPQVCFQNDRDELQHQIVAWLQTKEMADGWFSKGKGYFDVVDEYFKVR